MSPMSFIGWYISRFPDHLGKMWILKLFRGKKIRVRLKSKYDVVMEGNWVDATFRSAIKGKYDDVFGIVNCLSPGMAFLDIGANAGVFSLVASQRVGPNGIVVAFEPSSSNFHSLMNNIEIGACENIYPFRCAVDTSVRLIGFSQGPSTHSGVSRLCKNSSTKVFAIGGEVLDQLLSTLISSRSTVVKIDVEGAEMSVLKGLGKPFLSLKSIKAVVMEIDSQLLESFGAKSSEIYDFMAECHFVPTVNLKAHAHFNEVFLRTDCSEN